MAHSQSYPVTKPEKPPEQPHLKRVEEAKYITFSGWCAFAIAGILAFTTLFCIAFLGKENLFPTRLFLYEGLTPIAKEGYLDVHPFSPGTSTGIKKIFSVELPPKNFTKITSEIQDILTAYPQMSADRYRHCWLQNPSFEQPCYFDPAWITEFCSNEDNFGYSENSNGTFSPCFLLKIVYTGAWNPLAEEKEELSSTLQEHYDPGFVPVDCKMYINRTPVPDVVQMFPPKGFSHLYFPISSFNSEYYLYPLVAVKVNVEKGQDVELQCSIIARNSLILWDNGAFSISFRSTG